MLILLPITIKDIGFKFLKHLILGFWRQIIILTIDQLYKMIWAKRPLTYNISASAIICIHLAT